MTLEYYSFLEKIWNHWERERERKNEDRGGGGKRKERERCPQIRQLFQSRNSLSLLIWLQKLNLSHLQNGDNLSNGLIGKVKRLLIRLIKCLAQAWHLVIPYMIINNYYYSSDTLPIPLQKAMLKIGCKYLFLGLETWERKSPLNLNWISLIFTSNFYGSE